MSWHANASHRRNVSLPVLQISLECLPYPAAVPKIRVSTTLCSLTGLQRMISLSPDTDNLCQCHCQCQPYSWKDQSTGQSVTKEKNVTSSTSSHASVFKWNSARSGVVRGKHSTQLKAARASARRKLGLFTRNGLQKKTSTCLCGSLIRRLRLNSNYPLT